jgi:FAD/FMN-containing dehydrogenase
MSQVAPRRPLRKLDGVTVDGLLPAFRGQVILAGDEPYDEARRVWNGSIDRWPALVLRCAGVADVIAGIRLARELELPLAVRGGGHNIAGFGTCDDGVVLDLSPMKSVRVDPEARTARADPGLLWKELDHETQAFGLAVTGGVMSSTGIAGFTLGGGIGWLQRRYGLACDNLRSADLVTADGELVVASERDNPELLWGLRGGGGNFGVVTSFEYALHPVGPQVVSGLVAWPARQAREVLRFFREFAAQSPDDVTLVAISRTAPPAPFLPAEAHGTPIVAIAACHAGSVDDGLRVLAPLREFGSPVGDALGARPYPAFNSMFDASWAPGFENYWKAEYLAGLPDACIDVFADFASRHTSPLSDFKIAQLGGAVARVGEDDTAYGHRGAPFILNINTRWTDRAEKDRHVAHTRELWEATLPYTAGGAYTNFLGDEGADRVRSAYGDAKFSRLQGLKRTYDPHNVFRHNQNIPPG